MKYYIYILKLNNNTFYKGLTKNINRRYQEHLKGKCNSTKDKNPILVYIEQCNDRRIARKREKYWKSGIGREEIKRKFS